MSEQVSLTVELVQDLDIKGGQLLGIIRNPDHAELIQEYELDSTQGLLWHDLLQLLNDIMDLYDYEDLMLTSECLGKIVLRILDQAPGKYKYMKMLLRSDEEEYVGTVIIEVIEDLVDIYNAIQKDLKNIFTTQDEINRLVEGQ